MRSLANENTSIQNDTFLFFTSRVCGTCRGFLRAIQEVQKSIPFSMELIDVEQEKPKTFQYNVKGVPTLLRLRNNQEIARRSGSTTVDELLLWLESDLLT